ncbi:mycofactocin-coupled SDR family oxidoreductase [Mycolicibacterium hodleri]|uniref:NAD(P)-dependent oxidoreductase n=1 Tax=Mycolicibacterium hodleri TaxID=49897 RepID=A0A502DY61_9MYCO|nr:mycofactocin-coupled SDR family oxidoreductase [Mycolicibacterium hodleri]TPG29619.1 NAD(P)-dependent oxidoreductase [Mycolicibacterium hodleri]
MDRVKGKVAFITGVGRGQGRSHAVRMAEEGADIIGIDVLCDIESVPYAMANSDDLDETAALIERTGQRAILTRADVRDRDAVSQAVSSGIEQLGRLDIVVANAGVAQGGAPLWMISSQEWRDIIDVNLTGVFNTLAATVPAIQASGNGGSIIVTASGAGLRSVQNLAAYNASKHGAIGLAQTLANELANQNIRVNAVCPGVVGTPMVTANEPMFKVFRPDLENPTLDDCIEIYQAIGPMGHPWVDPEDISNAVLFLASDEARYVTGIVMPVDQGSTNRVG